MTRAERPSSSRSLDSVPVCIAAWANFLVLKDVNVSPLGSFIRGGKKRGDALD